MMNMAFVLPVALLLLNLQWSYGSLLRNLEYNFEQEKSSRINNDDVGEDPILTMNVSQICAFYGYPFEDHWVTTDDGYILYLIRIPHGKNNNSRVKYTKDRPVVLLQHGLIATAEFFVLNPRGQNLPLLLADRGVDVWMGNNRGVSYSTNHTTIDPKSSAFWKFSWDEMAEYDLPAMIYYILKVSNTEQIFYLGHSQGTAIGLAQFSQDTKLASHIKRFIALAPIARVKHCTTVMRALVPFAAEIDIFLDLFGHGSFVIPKPFLRFIARDMCQTWGNRICEDIMFALIGTDFSQLNATRIPIYATHELAGTSARNLLHWVQEVRSGHFQKYDYGSAKENMKHYGQKTPPLYRPSNMKLPVAVFRGGKDALADPEDVNWLLPELNVTHDINIPYYDHFDFVIAENVLEKVFSTVIKIITEESG